MKCRFCGTDMRQENYEGIEIDVCPICQGIWLGDGELQEIVKRRQEKFNQSQIDQVNLECQSTKIPIGQLKREVICPKCGCRMNSVNYSYCSGITIDKCPNNDGLWLDQGEIEKIQIFSEMWESRLRENKDKFADLANKLDQEEEEKDKKKFEAASPNRYGLVDTLIRGIVKLDQTVLV